MKIKSFNLPNSTIFLALFLCVLLFIGCKKKGDSSAVETASGSLVNDDNAIKDAYMSLNAKDSPEKTSQRIIEGLKPFKAIVYSENWDNSNKRNHAVDLTLKVPSSKFKPLVDWIKTHFEVENLNVSARKSEKYDQEIGNVVDGVAYSEVRLSITKEIGFYDSFLIGLDSGKEALKTSLETIVPVLSFLLPYALLFIFIKTVYNFFKRRKKQQ